MADTLVATRRTQLLRRETVAESTTAFYFTKPAGFRHRAGQSLALTLLNPPESDSMGDTRIFTIASAPGEADLMIATRMRNTAFKRVLGSSPPGLPAQIDGPEGDMVLPEDATRPAVFLAGGIGITPFLSMARSLQIDRLPHRIHLFYANRRPEDAAFLAELQGIERANPRFRMIPVMAEPEKSRQAWTGETGYIRRELLERHLPDVKAPVYYYAGPPAMSFAMKRMLAEIGIEEGATRHEEFYGY